MRVWSHFLFSGLKLRSNYRISLVINHVIKCMKKSLTLVNPIEIFIILKRIKLKNTKKVIKNIL